jgi:ATP-dependent Clp protease ATP-binding subunit ClpA
VLSQLRQVTTPPFTPEFRNRLSEVIYFNSLNEETIVYVVNKFLFELESTLEDKHYMNLTKNLIEPKHYMNPTKNRG